MKKIIASPLAAFIAVIGLLFSTQIISAQTRTYTYLDAAAFDLRGPVKDLVVTTYNTLEADINAFVLNATNYDYVNYYIFNKDGKLFVMSYIEPTDEKDADGVPLPKETDYTKYLSQIQRDENNRIIKFQPSENFIEKYEYNSNGQIIRVAKYFNGKKFYTKEHEYSDNNICATYYTELFNNGKNILTTSYKEDVYYKILSFDDYGNWTFRLTIDSDDYRDFFYSIYEASNPDDIFAYGYEYVSAIESRYITYYNTPNEPVVKSAQPTAELSQPTTKPVQITAEPTTQPAQTSAKPNNTNNYTEKYSKYIVRKDLISPHELIYTPFCIFTTRDIPFEAAKNIISNTQGVGKMAVLPTYDNKGTTIRCSDNWIEIQNAKDYGFFIDKIPGFEPIFCRSMSITYNNENLNRISSIDFYYELPKDWNAAKIKKYTDALYNDLQKNDIYLEKEEDGYVGFYGNDFVTVNYERAKSSKVASQIRIGILYDAKNK